MYAFGGKKLPYCMSCAMFAGGIRTIAARPALPKREVKKLLKASKAEAKLAATQPAPGPAPAPAPAEATVLADGVTPVGTDWEKPWWEDRQPTFAD